MSNWLIKYPICWCQKGRGNNNSKIPRAQCILEYNCIRLLDCTLQWFQKFQWLYGDLRWESIKTLRTKAQSEKKDIQRILLRMWGYVNININNKTSVIVSCLSDLVDGCPNYFGKRVRDSEKSHLKFLSHGGKISDVQKLQQFSRNSRFC